MWDEAQEEVIDSKGANNGGTLSSAGDSPLDGSHLHRTIGLLRRHPDLLLLGPLCGSLLLPQVCHGCTSIYVTAEKTEVFVALLSPPTVHTVIFVNKK